MTFALGQLRHLASIRTSNVDKKSYDGQLRVRLCNYTDVYKNDSISANLNFMVATATKEEVEKFTLAVGDTVFTKDSETADDIGIPAFVRETSEDLVCGYHLAIARPFTDSTNQRFLYWFLASNEASQQWAVLASGVTRVGIRQSDMGRLLVPIPPVSIQKVIADYLDRETAKIDDLVAKQERLIELLAEKRQAVITQAVTKGLDPAAPTKPSGIPWLGNVPAHWKVGPVRRFYEIVLGKMRQREQETPADILRPYLKAASVQSKGLVVDDTNTMWFSPDEVSNLSLRPGDVLVVEGGSIGQSAVVDESVIDYGFEKSLNRVRPRRNASSEYFYFYMAMARASGYVAMQCSGATLMHLPSDKLGRMVMPFPPESEQTEIVSTLKQYLSALRATEGRCRRLIALLRERRSALISAAVTGKIDVREGAA